MTLNGFYSNDSGILAFAGTAVYFPDGSVMVEADKENYSFPYRGWYWFVNESEARSVLNLPDADIPVYTGPVKIPVETDTPSRVNKVGHNILSREPKKFTPRPSYLIT
jgi:hypothetical protein